MYRILTLNGGGVKGYLTSLVLASFEERSGKKINEMFDLVVGSSAGGFLAGALDHLPASHCASILRDVLAKDLFRKNPFSFGGLLRPKYNTEIKCNAIDSILNSAKNTYNYDYGIVSYDILNRKPVVFNSLESVNTNHYYLTQRFNLTQAVCASSAAPIFWDPYPLENMLLVDAAFAANDPTNVAIKLALDNARKLEDLFIVNVGTGLNTRQFNFTSGANPLKWMIPTLDLLMTSQTQSTRMLYLKEDIDYHYFDTKLLEASDSIDDISDKNFRALEREAAKIIRLKTKEIDFVLENIT